jgi:hypothetical protein
MKEAKWEPIDACNFILKNMQPSDAHKCSFLDVLLDSGPTALHFSSWIMTFFPVESGMMNAMQLTKFLHIFNCYSQPGLINYFEHALDHKNTRKSLDQKVVTSFYKFKTKLKQIHDAIERQMNQKKDP